GTAAAAPMKRPNHLGGRGVSDLDYPLDGSLGFVTGDPPAIAEPDGPFLQAGDAEGLVLVGVFLAPNAEESDVEQADDCRQDPVAPEVVGGQIMAHTGPKPR